MKRKEILRTCVLTKEKLPKNDLIRIVKNKDNIIFVDPSGKQNGKGAYLKKNKETILMAKKKKILNKVFEMEIEDKIYEELIETIK